MSPGHFARWGRPRMLPRSLVVFLAVLLAGCQTQPVAPERLAGIRTLRVVSLIGDPVTLQSIGVMVFGNDERKLPAAGWGIDDDLSTRLAEMLRGRYEVLPARVDRAAAGDNGAVVR